MQAQSLCYSPNLIQSEDQNQHQDQEQDPAVLDTIEHQILCLYAKQDFEGLYVFLKNLKDVLIQLYQNNKLEAFSTHLLKIEGLKDLIIEILQTYQQLGTDRSDILKELFWILVNLFAGTNTRDNYFEQRVLGLTFFYLDDDFLLDDLLCLWANLIDNLQCQSFVITKVLTQSLVNRVLISGQTSTVDAFMRILAGVCLKGEGQGDQDDEKHKKEISILSSLYKDILTLLRRYIHKEEIVLNGLSYLSMISSYEFPSQFDLQIFELGNTLSSVKARAFLLQILGGFAFFQKRMLPYLSHLLDLLQNYLLTPEKEYFYLSAAYLLSNLLSESAEVTSVVLEISHYFFLHFLENCLQSTSDRIILESLISLTNAAENGIKDEIVHYMKLHIESLCSNANLQIRDAANTCLSKFNQVISNL